MKKRKISDLAAEFIIKQSTEELRQLSEAKIGQFLGVSKNYLSRKFKKDQKISCSGFILREKLHRAFFILNKNREKPIDKLAKELGFPTIDDFNIEFEKYHAITPERYKDVLSKTQRLQS
jgi:AraC-like DNA-binding protein